MVQASISEFKVQVFWEGHKFKKKSRFFFEITKYRQDKLEYFFKLLRPSWNIWTLLKWGKREIGAIICPIVELFKVENKISQEKLNGHSQTSTFKSQNQWWRHLFSLLTPLHGSVVTCCVKQPQIDQSTTMYVNRYGRLKFFFVFQQTNCHKVKSLADSLLES